MNRKAVKSAFIAGLILTITTVLPIQALFSQSVEPDFTLLTTLKAGSTIALDRKYIYGDDHNGPLMVWDRADFSVVTELYSYHQKLWPFFGTTFVDDNFIYNSCGTGNNPGTTDLYIWSKPDFTVHTILAGMSGCPSALHVDDTYIYVGTSNHVYDFGQYLYIIDKSDYSTRANIPGRIKSIYSDRKYIFVADLSGYPKIYRKSDFVLQTTLPVGPSMVNSIFSDREFIYTGGGDGGGPGNIYIWNYTDFSLHTTLETGQNIYFLDICMDPRYRYLFSCNWHPSGGSQNGLYIWNRSDFSQETYLSLGIAGKDIATDGEYLVSNWGGVYKIPPTKIRYLASGDYTGDSTADVGIFRRSNGLWAIRGVTRAYFGGAADIPVSGDYTGDGTSNIGIFRAGSGLWAIRGITRAYFGSNDDFPVPGDFTGDGICDIGIFRNGLWAIRRVTRGYFGRSGDIPVPGDYNGDSTQEMALFRESTGLWASRGVSRFYYGKNGDIPVPGIGEGFPTWSAGIFRPTAGLWAIRNNTRFYFGSSSDLPISANYLGTGTDRAGIFRSESGLWAARGITRLYFGTSFDQPVIR